MNRLETKVNDKRIDFILGEKTKDISFEDTLKQFLGYIKDKEANITIIDLRKRLDFSLDNKGQDRILVVKINDIDVGFVVDDASEVIRIEQKQIAAPKKGVAGIKTEYLEGIAKLEERLIILLDLDKILSTEERIKIEEITEVQQ